MLKIPELQSKTDLNLSIKIPFSNHLAHTLSTQPKHHPHALTTTTISQLKPSQHHHQNRPPKQQLKGQLRHKLDKTTTQTTTRTH